MSGGGAYGSRGGASRVDEENEYSASKYRVYEAPAHFSYNYDQVCIFIGDVRQAGEKDGRGKGYYFLYSKHIACENNGDKRGRGDEGTSSSCF